MVEWLLIVASLVMAVSAVFGNLTHPLFVYLSVLVAFLSLIVGLDTAPFLKSLPSLLSGLIALFVLLVIVRAQFFAL